MANGKMYTQTFTLPDGRRKYVRAKTKEELAAKVEKLRTEMRAGVNVGDNTTFGEFAQIWYDTYKRPVLKANSAETLKQTLNYYILPHLASLRLRDIKPLHIQRMMTALDGYSTTIHKKVLQATTAIFTVAVENELIIKSPVTSTIRAHGVPAAETVPLTPKQTADLLNSLEGTRAYLMAALMLGVGLRGEEVRGLRWSDVDFCHGLLMVDRVGVFIDGETVITSDMKSAQAHRAVPIPCWLEQVLRSAMAESNSIYVLPMLNGQPLSPAAYRSLCATIKRRYPEVNIHPHLLRHTCVTRWTEMGLDVKEIQYMAGHATPDMTMRVYAHYDRAGRTAETAERIRSMM